MDSSSAPAIDAAFTGMSFAEVCALALQQQAQIKHISAVNAKMAHEMAVLKRLKFAATSGSASPPSRRACWKRPSTKIWRRWSRQAQPSRQAAW